MPQEAYLILLYYTNKIKDQSKGYTKGDQTGKWSHMTDCYKVYTKVLKTIKHFVKDQHPGHVVTIARMIAGLVMIKKTRLSEMICLPFVRQICVTTILGDHAIGDSSLEINQEFQ